MITSRALEVLVDTNLERNDIECIRVHDCHNRERRKQFTESLVGEKGLLVYRAGGAQGGGGRVSESGRAVFLPPPFWDDAHASRCFRTAAPLHHLHPSSRQPSQNCKHARSHAEYL